MTYLRIKNWFYRNFIEEFEFSEEGKALRHAIGNAMIKEYEQTNI